MRILAIDHGTVRIGLAISDELELVASPLKTIDARESPQEVIAEIVRQKDIGHVVIGMPYRMSGEKGSAASRTEKFADTVRKALPHHIPIDFVDERLSSVEAEASLSRAGITGKKERDAVVDQLAAVVILQDFLNHRRGPEGLLLPDEAYDFDWTDDNPGRRDRRR